MLNTPTYVQKSCILYTILSLLLPIAQINSTNSLYDRIYTRNI